MIIIKKPLRLKANLKDEIGNIIYMNKIISIINL